MHLQILLAKDNAWTFAHVDTTAEETRYGEEWSFVEASPSGQDLAQQIAENDCPSDDNDCSF